MKPIAIDLFCGLGGWTEGLLAAGYDVVGFDNELHEYGEHRYPAQLVLQDVRTIDGSRFAGVDLIVASPPCTDYSYMAMPWSRAKQIARALRGCGEFPEGYDGSRSLTELTELFDACFRIQAEASKAGGRHVPLVVENVCGAQPWVGPARWHYGSYYLWGDVPALMPIVRRARQKGGRSDDGKHWERFTSDGVKVPGLDWNGYRKGDPNYRGQEFNPAAQGAALREQLGIKNSGGSWFNVAHNTTSGKGQNPDGRKVGGDWFGQGRNSPMRQGHSKSPKRKAAAALIAKIPLELSRWIGRAWLPA